MRPTYGTHAAHSGTAHSCLPQDRVIIANLPVISILQEQLAEDRTTGQAKGPCQIMTKACLSRQHFCAYDVPALSGRPALSRTEAAPAAAEGQCFPGPVGYQ